jgi:hypothetical protein
MVEFSLAVRRQKGSALARVAIQCAAAKGADCFCVYAAADLCSFLICQVAGLRARQYSVVFLFHNASFKRKPGPFLAPQQLAFTRIAVRESSTLRRT